MKVVSLKKIKRYQKTLDLLISFASFSRLMREMIQARSWDNNLRMQKIVIRAAQEIFETMLINIFESKWIWSINFRLLLIFLLVCNLTTIHVKRVIIQKKDLNFIQLLNRSDRKSVIHFAFECLLIFKDVWSTSNEAYIDKLSKFSYKLINTYNRVIKKKIITNENQIAENDQTDEDEKIENEKKKSESEKENDENDNESDNSERENENDNEIESDSEDESVNDDDWEKN